MRWSVAITEAVHQKLWSHLRRVDGQEELCFALWNSSNGQNRASALVIEPILPRRGERNNHGNVSFESEYFERAIRIACERGAGVAFLHSHPAAGWQGMSCDDVRAEEGMAGAVLAATGQPLVGMTVGAVDGAWSARFWEREGRRAYRRQWCESVRVVGDKLSVTYCDELLPPPQKTESLDCTISVFGEDAQSRFSRLRIGIVGLGSVGMLIAEALARHGMQHGLIFDFDAVEKRNCDRGLYTNESVLERPKVEVSAQRMREAATARDCVVEAFELSVCEPEGYRRVLDCDVLFSCVDRPWPRAVLNHIAYAHLIPVVDGGIKVTCKTNGTFRGADWKAHTVTHGHRCLLCHRQYDPGLVSVEQAGHLDDPSYVKGLPDDHPARTRQNVFLFSMDVAARELRQLIMLTMSPCGEGASFGENYHFVLGRMDRECRECDTGCIFPKLEGKGEAAGHPGTGRHVVAEEARRARKEGLLQI